MRCFWVIYVLVCVLIRLIYVKMAMFTIIPYILFAICASLAASME